MNLKVENFGVRGHKIILPSKSDATFELYNAIEKVTSIPLSLEDDGYIVVHTYNITEIDKVKQAAQKFLMGK